MLKKIITVTFFIIIYLLHTNTGQNYYEFINLKYEKNKNESLIKIYNFYKKKRYINVIKVTIKNTEYLLYLKGMSYYQLKKKIFNIISIDKKKRDQKNLKCCYIYFYTLIKKYPNSKYIEKIKNKQKKTYNQIAETKYLYYEHLIKQNKTLMINSILLDITNNYTNSKTMKKTLYTIKKIINTL